MDTSLVSDDFRPRRYNRNMLVRRDASREADGLVERELSWQR
jgi:hypothetical protein